MASSSYHAPSSAITGYGTATPGHDPWIPSNEGVLLVLAEDGYRFPRRYPGWYAEQLLDSGLAKLAVIRNVYPRSWPDLAEVVYGEDEDVVVIEQLRGLPDEKPPISNPFMPGY